MTGLARAIAGGRRGGRLRPSKPDTELGRAATAFDEMLDALEGAERAARTSEERTRRFVADAAHELRTPIAGVRAAAEAVVAETDPARRERLAVLLVRESERASHLVDDLLELARIDAGLTLRSEPVDLHALASAALERVRLVAPGVAVELTGERVWVSGDADRLTQILANLTDNARRAMDGTGTLAVTVTRAGPARVLVTDTGPGVAPADRERIFDRLVRLDDSRDRGSSAGGAGLGLAIARGIARAHGGDLHCLSRVDGRPGAAFELILP
jgi:signal transduction histidine kinase